MIQIHHILRFFIVILALANASLASESQRQTICLNGIWDYVAANTTEDQIPQGKWNTLPIPGDSTGHGAGLFNISPANYDTPHSWFRRTFYVPKSWSDGRRVKLKFLGVDGPNKMFVNGQEVAKHAGETLAFVVDITDQVKFGQDNQLAVWVKKVQHSYYTRGNIHRSVYLMCTPKVYVEYSHVLPSVKNMTLTVRTRIRNEDSKKQTVKLNWAVKDNGKEVLTLPEKQVTIDPGASVEVESAAHWADPVLWGFGKYGKPYLYYLQTTLTSDGVADETFDRFGFREFTSKGSRFLFNGKPYFVRGDLISRFWPVTENPDYLATYYQVMRSANMNFQRLHSHSPNNFEAHYWYQVGDELGHLVEAQMTLDFDKRKEGGPGPDDPAFRAMWKAYVNENFNHPSLVMWCPDNEGLRGVIPNAEKAMPPWNRFTTYLRKLDPTRIVDFQDGCELFAGVQMGIFDRENFMTFNKHPYADLVAAVEETKKQTGFDDSVPVLIGEMFPHPSNIDMIGNPIGSYIEQKRRGAMMADNIIRLYKYKVSGIILCALQDYGFLGYSSAKDVHLGPWSDYVLVRDETKPDKPVIGERLCHVKVRWPSMSGEGTKCEWFFTTCSTTGAAGGYGFNCNWFDPTRPMFYSNITDKLVGDAYKKIGGKEVPLGPYRAPEVIICFGVDGKPIEGAYVTLIPQDGQAVPSTIMTDKDGTAWFHIWDTGRYTAKVFYRENGEEKTAEKTFDIKSRPLLTGKAGYDYITWVDMGGIDIAQRQAELAQPAEFSSSTIRTKDEFITNGDMEYWLKDQNTNLADWKGAATQESKIVHSGKYSVKLTGDTAQLVRDCRLKPGYKYKLSGWIYKISGNGHGSIGLRNGKWDWLLQLDGSDTPGKWVHVEAEYTATGAEMYFYCYNSYMGQDGACLYDDISLKEIGGKKTPNVLKPGPFTLTDGGFIHNWLVLGPFPNAMKDHKFIGFRTDDLAAVGGETKAAPTFGKKLKVHFPKDDFWLEGDDTIQWQYWESGDKVDLTGLLLPDRGISISPPVYVSAYLACWVESPEDRKAWLAVGSDDAHKIWLNGTLVGKLEIERGAAPDQELYPVELKKGKNLLLVKILQSVGGWECYVRFLNNDNKKPMTDLKIVLKP